MKTDVLTIVVVIGILILVYCIHASTVKLSGKRDMMSETLEGFDNTGPHSTNSPSPFDETYCPSSICTTPNFTHDGIEDVGTVTPMSAQFNGFVCLQRNDDSGNFLQELIIGLPTETEIDGNLIGNSLRFIDLANTTYEITPHNVTKYKINNVIKTDAWAATISNNMEISILEPNPYEYDFQGPDRFPIYLRLKRTSDNKYFDIIHATKLNDWGNVHKVMNCYSRPIKFLYSGRDDHLVVINPNNTDYVDIGSIDNTVAFHSNDYRNSSWTANNPIEFVIMDELDSNNKTINNTYTDLSSRNVPRINIYKNSDKSNSIDFMYKTNKTKKFLDLRRLSHTSDDSSTASVDNGKNKYIQMVASASGSYVTATTDDISNQYMMIQFEADSKNYNDAQRYFYPTIGFGDINGTNPTVVWYCLYIKMRKNDNFLSKIKFGNTNDHAIVTIVNNATDKLIVFNADKMRWDNQYLYGAELMNSPNKFTLYQSGDNVGITFDGNNMTNLNQYFPFPQPNGMLLRFSHFKNGDGTESGYQFNPDNHSNIVRMKNLDNDNILDIDTGRTGALQYNMMPESHLVTWEGNNRLYVGPSDKVRVCNQTYDQLKNNSNCHPFNSNVCTGVCIDIPNNTNGYYVGNTGGAPMDQDDSFYIESIPAGNFLFRNAKSIYTDHDQRYRTGYSNSVAKLCKTPSSDCIHIKRADQVDWRKPDECDQTVSCPRSIERPFGEHIPNPPSQHVMDVIQIFSSEFIQNNYIFKLYTEFSGIGITDRKLQAKSSIPVMFTPRDVENSLMLELDVGALRLKIKHNTDFLIHNTSDSKIKVNSSDLNYKFTILKNNKYDNAVIIGWDIGIVGSSSGFVKLDNDGYLVSVNTDAEATVFYIAFDPVSPSSTSTSTSTSTPTPAPTPTSLEDGSQSFQIKTSTQVRSTTNNKIACLAIDRDTAAYGRHVRLEDCDTTKNSQKWNIKFSDNFKKDIYPGTYYGISHALNSNLCLDYDGGRTEGYGGTKISGSGAFEIRFCDTGNNNNFFGINSFTTENSKIATARNTSKCINVEAGDSLYDMDNDEGYPILGDADCGSATTFDIVRVNSP